MFTHQVNICFHMDYLDSNNFLKIDSTMKILDILVLTSSLIKFVEKWKNRTKFWSTDLFVHFGINAFTHNLAFNTVNTVRDLNFQPKIFGSHCVKN